MSSQAPVIASCPQCGTQLAPMMLACPRCGRLVQADRLADLAQTAREASARGDVLAELTAWREALELLPHSSKQHQVISAKITELGSKIPADAIPAEPTSLHRSTGAKVTTAVGVVGLMLWKLKAIFAGLTKGTTLLSMLLSMGVYWTIWGWKFALGLVLSIYVHEMGHVIALRRYGFKSNAPMFIPGLGAVIRMRQQIVNPLEDAHIGLAGPIYGLGASIVALALWMTTQHPVFAAIAGVGAWINIFNLLPIGPLDGGRAFHAMSRLQKLIAMATVAGAYFYTENGLLLLIGIVCFARAVGDKPNGSGNLRVAITYCFLILTLAAISTVLLQIADPATLK